jgi:hypothetical protein
MQIQQDFQSLSQQFADSLKRKYSRDDAGVVVFLGSLGLILVGFLKLLGPFSLPLLFNGARRQLRDALPVFSLFALGLGVYGIVLLIFFFHHQFINSRYISLLNLLAIPFVVAVVYGFSLRYPKWSRVLVVVAVLVMLDNVISLGAKKTHYVEAGQWLASHHHKTSAVFYDDPRIGYYAGWGYPKGQSVSVRSLRPDQVRMYEIFVIEADSDEEWLASWMEGHGLQRWAQFANRKGDAIHIVARGAPPADAERIPGALLR